MPNLDERNRGNRKSTKPTSCERTAHLCVQRKLAIHHLAPVKATAPTPSPVSSGEVNLLRQALQEAVTTRNEKVTLDVLKRIISSMTLGMDLSELIDTVVLVCFLLPPLLPSSFTHLLKASRTTNLVQKKMVYFFLQTYSRFYPSTAIMAIASFLSDFRDPNPKVRGLALRSLSSLLYALMNKPFF